MGRPSVPNGAFERKIVCPDAQIWSALRGEFVHLGPRAIFLGRSYANPHIHYLDVAQIREVEHR